MERKLAAILSADVQGYSRLMGADEESTVRTLTTYRDVMASLIRQHQGRVVDAPGDNLLAEFASVVDAVQCAVAVQHDLATRNASLPAHRQMAFRIGINLGDVLVDGERIYGDGVNIAARLEGLAEGGGICVSGTVYDQIADKLDLRYVSLGEQAVKNIARPVRVYRIQMEPKAPERAFIGRERELDALTVSLERALAGVGHLVMLAGDAGIGKTRLAHEVAQVAGHQGATILWGRCYDQSGAPPYWPWRQAMRLYAQHLASEVLLTHMGPGVADIAEIVPELKVRFPDLSSPPPLEPDQARFRLFDSVTTFLQTASQHRPIVVILDDLHWADRSSLLLLEFVAREIASAHLLLIGAYRESEVSRRHPLVDTLGRLVRAPTFQRVVLSGLSLPHVAQLLQHTSGVTASSSVVEAVYTRTEGNPLFVTQIAQLLAHAGGAWAGAIPPAVTDAIGQQLSRLSEACQRILTVASALGREFEFGVLARVTERPDDDVLDLLDEALEARVLEVAPGGSERYQFRHALIQQTLNDGLSPSRKVRLHARIAQALEALYGTDADAHATELVDHCIAAEPVLGRARAAHYSQVAGEQALASHAYDEALRHLQYALAATHGQAIDRDTADLYFGLARAQAATLERPYLLQTSAYLQRAFAYCVERGDVARAVTMAVHQFGTLEGTDQRLAHALALVAPDSHEAGRLLSHSLTVVGISAQRPDESTRAYERALAIAQKYGDRALEMETLVNAACLDSSSLRLHACLDKHGRAVALATDVDQPFVEVHAHVECAAAWYSLGDLAKAMHHVNAALAAASRTRARWHTALVLSVQQGLAYLQGDWDAARRWSDQGLELSPQFEVLLSNRAVLECQVGNIAQCHEYLDVLLNAGTLDAQSPRGTDPNVAVPLVARITGNTARTEVADAMNRGIITWPAATPWYRELAWVGLALSALQRGDPLAIESCYTDLRSVQGRMPYACPHIAGDRLLGLLASACGHFEVAAAHCEAALAFCRQAGYRPELAWTCYDYAGMLIDRIASGAIGPTSPAARETAAALLEEALTIAHALAMRPLHERAAARKAQLLALPAGPGRPPPRARYPASLSQREVDVLRLLATGKTNPAIAAVLSISPKTVTHHVTSILSKIGAANRTEAAAYAARTGLVTWQ
jgi:class 3 adenylate cyclase/DNA-binding CsgD family transcriptional regulator/tetratricopeptide (TPR) repeat protein